MNTQCTADNLHPGDLVRTRDYKVACGKVNTVDIEHKHVLVEVFGSADIKTLPIEDLFKLEYVTPEIRGLLIAVEDAANARNIPPRIGHFYFHYKVPPIMEVTEDIIRSLNFWTLQYFLKYHFQQTNPREMAGELRRSKQEHRYYPLAPDETEPSCYNILLTYALWRLENLHTNTTENTAVVNVDKPVNR